MATVTAAKAVKGNGGTQAATQAAVTAVVQQSASVFLPTSMTLPVDDLSGLLLLLYGGTKIGKSTWASESDNPLFLATEPGLNHLKRFEVTIDSWETLLKACALLAQGQHPYKTVIIDTVDNAYLMCQKWVMDTNRISDLGADNNRGYSLVNNEFRRVINRLAQLPYGLFLISHAQDVEIKTRTGKYTKTVPTLPGKSRQMVLGLVDVVLFADLEVITSEDGPPVERRVVRTKPSAAYEAGDRTGKLPDSLPLRYAAFAQAWREANAKDAKPETTTSNVVNLPELVGAVEG